MNRRPLRAITDSEVRAFSDDGLVCLRGMLDREWIVRMSAATDRVMADPGPLGTDLNKDGSPGRFFQDVYMWARDPEFRAFAFDSPVAEIAAACLGSAHVNILADMLLVKEPHTPKEAPWHHDQPYNCVNGWQVCGMWIPFDTASLANGAAEWIRGSHRWGHWYEAEAFDPTKSFARGEFEPIPDIEGERARYDIVHFDMEPGDILVNHLLVLHYSRGNDSDIRRRALTYRWAGDDATFAVRKAAAPLLAEAGLAHGDPFPPAHDLFPRVWPRPAADHSLGAA